MSVWNRIAAFVLITFALNSAAQTLPAGCVQNAISPAGKCEPIEQDIASFEASSGVIEVYVDNVKVNPVVPPFIKNGRTYVELAAIFNALGADVGFQSMPVGRITAVRNDLNLAMHLGYLWGSKDLRGRRADNFKMDAAPFLAKRGSVSLNKIVVPVSFIASATGADVVWIAASKRVNITRGRTYFFDWNGAGTYIQYTDQRNQLSFGCPAGFVDAPLGRAGARWCKNQVTNEAFFVPTGTVRNACLASGKTVVVCDGGRFNATEAQAWRGVAICSSGASFDDQSQACMEGTSVLGPFTQRYRDRCSALGLGVMCASNRWDKANFIRVMDTADVASAHTQASAIALLKSNPELFGMPNEQNELVSAGLYSPNGTKKSDYVLSESALPPFVLSARRQTDQMARSAYLLMPLAVRQSTAFVFVDRLAQDPDRYIKYLARKQRVVLIGTFNGLGGITQADDAKHTALKIRHAREVFKLRASIALVKSMGLTVVDVLWALGDTHANTDTLRALNVTIKSNLQARFDNILNAAGLGSIRRDFGYGGDELAIVGFAKQAGPTMSAYVEYTNAAAVAYYDGDATTRQLVESKFTESGVSVTNDFNAARFELYVLSRAGFNGAPSLATTQAEADMMNRIRALPPVRLAKAYIVDFRHHNGAVNVDSALKTCTHLGFSGWGTGANAIGSAIGSAKLLTLSNNRAAAKRLLLEAVAHDQFSNGYAEAQKGELARRVVALPVTGASFNHHPGYTLSQINAVYEAFQTVNGFVNERMKQHFSGTSCFANTDLNPIQVTAQFWRHFETEVHLVSTINDGFNVPGLYRKPVYPGAGNPMEQVLDPTRRGNAVNRVDLSTLEVE